MNPSLKTPIACIIAALLLMLVAVIPAAKADDNYYRPLYGGNSGSGFTTNALAFDGTSRVLTGVVGNYITLIRVMCTADCYVAIAPTGSQALLATTATGFLLNADTPEYFRTKSGETVAVIQASGAGTLIVHELVR